MQIGVATVADYYTQFSFGFDLKNEAEKKWIEAAYDAVTEISEAVAAIINNWIPLKDASKASQQSRDLSVFKFLGSQYLEYVEMAKKKEWDFRDFDLSIEELHVNFVSEESGNPDQVGVFVQMFLKKFSPKEALSFSWSETSSDMQEDGFGGGSVFITAEKVEIFSTFEWRDNLYAKFKEQRE